MSQFDNELHTLILSEDGSYTAYSKEYSEHYHSTKDGALYESLIKHVVPAFSVKKDLKEINILDICFGLGFNTLATLYFIKENKIKTKVKIYSPELDGDLIESLGSFVYPREFAEYKNIIESLIEKNIYEDENLYIEIFVGDARKYILGFEDNIFDIVYQDAFSPSANPLLWTQEYFKDIERIMKPDGVLTTYSIALATRLALYENNFNVYINSGENFRDATVASLGVLEAFKKVDMEHKIACNPDKKSLRD